MTNECLRCNKKFDVKSFDDHFSCCDVCNHIIKTETVYNDGIKCPYCGHIEHVYAWKYQDGEDVQCNKCSKIFELNFDRTTTYYASKKSEYVVLNDEL